MMDGRIAIRPFEFEPPIRFESHESNVMFL